MSLLRLYALENKSINNMAHTFYETTLIVCKEINLF